MEYTVDHKLSCRKINLINTENDINVAYNNIFMSEAIRINLS